VRYPLSPRRLSTRFRPFVKRAPTVRPLLAALALALALPAPTARGAEAPVISDVRVEGNRRVEVDAIKAAVSKKGTALDPKRLDADVRALMKLGFFADVVVEQEGDPQRPVLVYRVVERPTVREATIVGNEELSKEDLKDAVEVKPFSMLDRNALKKDVKRIQEKYVEKGFYLAEVKERIEELPDNQVAVRYVVDEKAKVLVKEIRFVGNAKVPTETLRAAMLTQEGGLLSAINSSGTYREDMFQRDLAALQAAYLDEGYVNVKVGKPSLALSPDRRYLFVTIPVEEGEQFRIGKIAFGGELLDEEPRLRKLLQTKSGNLFSRTKLGADLFAAGDVYKDKGYAYANVTPLTTIDAEQRLVDLTYEVQPGLRTRFERIEVVGNDKTRDKVVRRELRFYEGELYSGSAIRVSKGRVMALGFFETVEITTRKGSAEDLIVATVEVKEKATGSFQLGAGFSSYENFILTGQISQQNFFGWGQTLTLQVQWSSIRQLGQIQFVEPYFLDTKWTFAFDVYATESFYQTFTRRAVGGNMTWGYELNGLASWWPFAARLEDMRVFGTYKNEHVRVTGAAGGASNVVNAFKSGTTSSLTLAWQWDKRDNRLFASDGWFLSASAELAPPVLAPSALFGDQVNLFTRYGVDARAYRPLLFGVVAKAKLTLGLIRGWHKAGDVAISENFYLGGINSVRGYRFLTLAPQQRVFCNAGNVAGPTCLVAVGGNKQAILNLELEFPMFQAAGIRGVVFADAGNAFAPGQWTDKAVTLSLYKSVGFGFRWFSPIGPLRFEWGIPLDRRKDASGAYLDQAMDFQFTIGNFF
jgi:outer membrane protein insertion porin family